jgi:hypothetical protein
MPAMTAGRDALVLVPVHITMLTDNTAGLQAKQALASANLCPRRTFCGLDGSDRSDGTAFGWMQQVFPRDEA